MTCDEGTMLWAEPIKAYRRRVLSRHDRTVQLLRDEGYYLHAAAFRVGYEVSD